MIQLDSGTSQVIGSHTLTISPTSVKSPTDDVFRLGKLGISTHGCALIMASHQSTYLKHHSDTSQVRFMVLKPGDLLDLVKEEVILAQLTVRQYLTSTL